MLARGSSHITLVKRLMETGNNISHVPAVRWGIENEDVARDVYNYFNGK